MALGFLAVDNPIRWSAIYICSNGLDELALILIFINTVMLTFYDPHDLPEYNSDNVRRTGTRSQKYSTTREIYRGVHGKRLRQQPDIYINTHTHTHTHTRTHTHTQTHTNTGAA